MRTRLLSVLWASALVLGVTIAGVPIAQAADTSSVAGTVRLPAGFAFTTPDHPGTLTVGHVNTSGDSPWVDVSFSVDIQPDGTYRADGLVPGQQYVVVVNTNDLLVNRPGLLTTAYGGWAATSETIKFSSFLDFSNPGLMTITAPAAGTTLPNIDVTMVQGATIAGFVTPANADSPWIEFYEVVNNEIVSYSQWIEVDGSYSITVVPGSTVVIYGCAAGFLKTYVGGSTDFGATLPHPGISQIKAPGSGLVLSGTNIDLVRDGAPPVKPMTSFTLGAGMTLGHDGEILSVDSRGVLWGYGLGSGNTISAGFRLGTGFSSYQIFGPGDLNADGLSDVLGIGSDGKLWLFPGNGPTGLSKGKQVGWGWTTGWRMIPAGDLTGDGQPDLLGIDPNGDLYLYQGKSDGTFPYPKVKVGWGWKNWNLFSAGDLNGDGKADILGIDAKGDLYQYRGSGNGANPFPYAKQQAGWGWNGGFVMAAGADLNGDGYADIVSRQTSTKNLYVYEGLGDAKFGPKTLIDTGW